MYVPIRAEMLGQVGQQHELKIKERSGKSSWEFVSGLNKIIDAPCSFLVTHGSRVVAKMTKQRQFPLYRLENPPRIGPRVTRVQGARSFHEVYVLLLLHWDREHQIENWCL